METVRKPFEGVRNIVRFNWHLYVIALSMISIILFAERYFDNNIAFFFNITAYSIAISIFISLAVSCYIYDFSNLYAFDWLKDFDTERPLKIVNVHAGFDETSTILSHRFKQASLSVFDFYDPKLHTEISIRRARKIYLPYPNTQQIHSSNIPLDDEPADYAFVIFSAHEIRNDDERIAFFKALKRTLKPNGKIIVTEHLRDVSNLLAYNVGAFHFHTAKTWLHTFKSAGLITERRIKTTPFITHFILQKNGNTH